MDDMEYRDLDAAIEDSTTSLKKAIDDEVPMLAIIQVRKTGQWWCRLPGPGDAVVITDNYDDMVDFLASYGW